jgi:4-amino-4-deoxy-L-arabinose transferase-like glycosyltransferase
LIDINVVKEVYMSTITTVDKKNREQNEQASFFFHPAWQTALMYAVGLVLLLLGLYLRLHDLGLPFDRDGYDEGVYWQSLRAMAAGHTLYQQIFYSQPPFFLLSVYPFYILFGQTLWAARLGIAVVSLTGLIGAFLLGKAMGGRIGAIAGLLLMVADPFYLSQSQKLQAEAPSAGLSFLAVGLAYVWWENPDGTAGILLGTFCGIAASLSIMSKLLGVTILIPLGLLMLAHLWRVLHKPRESRLRYAWSLIAGIIAFLLTTVALVLPFIGSSHQMWAGVVTFHTTAGTVFKSTLASNFPMMLPLLTSITAILALFSTIVALLRRDWRTLPLIAWLVATVLVLLNQAPLFHHHLVALIPPLVALAIVGIIPIKMERKTWTILLNIGSAITLVLLMVALIMNLQGEQLYFQGERLQAASSATQSDLRVSQALHDATKAGELVITDDQFIAALADRNTPPSLVDTSIVRIDTHYLTLQQLIQAASQPQVHAVLFYTGRLSIKSVSDFHVWIATHGFRLIRHYKPGQELWIRE